MVFISIVGADAGLCPPSVHASARSEPERPKLDTGPRVKAVPLTSLTRFATTGRWVIVMKGAVITGLPSMTVKDGAPLAAPGMLEVTVLSVLGVRLGAAQPTHPTPGTCCIHLPTVLL